MRLLPEARRAAFDAYRRVRLVLKSIVNERLDAVDLLLADHLRARMLIFRAQAARDSSRRIKLGEQLRAELMAHARIEETGFYEECEKLDELRPLALKLREEHRLMKEQLERGKIAHDEWIGHMDEEEAVLFPRARELFEREFLLELGARIESAQRRWREAA
jgi:hypothetical protein